MQLLVLDDVTPASHKTKEMAKYIEGLDQSKRVLIIDGADKVNTLLCRSTSNLYEADVLPAKVYKQETFIWVGYNGMSAMSEILHS